ncbi:MAG: hypothetical protein HQ582_06095 [Planctomycetes bacterium]|nr:hypothetical protein [Planctomycetota bacterium]
MALVIVISSGIVDLPNGFSRSNGGNRSRTVVILLQRREFCNIAGVGAGGHSGGFAGHRLRPTWQDGRVRPGRPVRVQVSTSTGLSSLLQGLFLAKLVAEVRQREQKAAANPRRAYPRWASLPEKTCLGYPIG